MTMTRTRTSAAGLPLALALLLTVKGAPINELSPLGAPATCDATSCNFFFLCNELQDESDPTSTTGTHCGQVDVRGSIPPSLFKPENSATLQAYINYTQGIQLFEDGHCAGFDTKHPTLGSCADQGYKYKHANQPGRVIGWAGRPQVVPVDPQPAYPSPVFEMACLDGCGCCANYSTQVDGGDPDGLIPCCHDPRAYPTPAKCGRVPLPLACSDTPLRNATHSYPEWCGLCGPTLNSDRFIDFYFPSKVQSVCEPRAEADKAYCAVATTPLACRGRFLRCAWRAPTLAGQCVVGNNTDCTGFFPAGGVACGGVVCMPTFDCAICGTGKTVPGLSFETFGWCCDDCEFCVATGNGTARDEAACGKFNGSPGGLGPNNCVWKDGV